MNNPTAAINKSSIEPRKDRKKVVYIEICYDGVPPETSVDTAYDVIKRESIDFSNSNTKEQINLLDQALKQAISTAKQQRAFLAFSSFKPFEFDSSLGLLELLQASDLDFKFLDFESFDTPQVLSCFIDIIKRRKTSRQNNLNDKENNPNYKNVGKHLTDEDFKAHRVRRQQQKKFFDTNKVNAQIKLNTMENINHLAAVARQLNDSGILTARGKQHTAKSVSRLRENREDLKSYFEKDTVLESLVAEQLGPELAIVSKQKIELDIPLDWGNSNTVRDFTRNIQFSFKEALKEDVVVSFHRKKDVSLFKYSIPAGQTQANIDAFKETTLLPGLYYLCFKGTKQYKELWVAITLLGIYAQ